MLTKSQAIAEGYTLCGRAYGDAYQRLLSIEDLDDQDIVDFRYTLVLADKEPIYHTVSINDLKCLVVDDYYNNDKFSSDDSGELERIVDNENELFKEFTDKLNEVYKKLPMWMLTKIRLVPDDFQMRLK